MTPQRLLAASTLFLLLAACGSASSWAEEASQGIDVFGIELGSSSDYKEFRGVVAVEEPCLKGVERYFDALDLPIGYSHTGKVRKITTRNPATRISGIRPGDSFATARKRALAAGFREAGAPHRFKNDRCSLTLLVDKDGRVFGVTVEVLD